MAEKIFLNILHMDITASFIILAVFVLRFLLKKQPKIFSYVLWIAVLYRLSCPVSFSSMYSVFQVFNNKDFKTPVIEYIKPVQWNRPANKTGILQTEDNSNKAVLLENASVTDYKEVILSYAKWIWLFGVFIIFSYNIIKMVNLRIKLRDTTIERENIYTSPRISTPFVIGIIKPIIYLPGFLEGSEKEYIILHEQTHIKRKDNLTRLLAFTALCIHWFNPLVWAAFFYSGEDMEMSCDEAVIRKMGRNIKKEYSVSLLNLAAGYKMAGRFPLQFGGPGTKKRIKNVLNCNRTRISAVIIVMLLVLTSLFILISNPKETKVKEVQVTGLTKDAETGKIKKTADITQEETNKKAKTFKEELQGGIIYVNIKSIARSAKLIDRFVLAEDNGEWEKQAEGMSLAFADNCVYKINYEMDKIKYTETDFDTFASLINKDYLHENKLCELFFTDGVIVEARLLNGNYYNGISYYDKIPGQLWLEELIEEELYKSYIKTGQVKADVSQAEGKEVIEIYTDKKGSSASEGIIIVKDSKGKILYSEKTDIRISGLASESINTGTIGGKDFLMRVYMEDRDTYGSYIYEVFCLYANGAILQIAGSEFEFNTEKYSFPKKAFRKWVKNMDYYFKTTRFLTGRYEGNIITDESVVEKDKYHYKFLKERLK